MAKVAIVTSGHFCTSPRVWREADALAGRGYDVTVIGVSYDAVQATLDRQMLATRRWRLHVAADLVGQAPGRRLIRTWRRVQSRAGRALVRRRIESPHALGYAVPSLRAAVRAVRADLTILHLEPALSIATQLLTDGIRYGVDMEDWHSENDSGSDWGGEAQQAYLRKLEATALRGAAHRSATSYVMAAALATQYDCPMPITIYNAVTTRPYVPAGEGPLRLVWFSQTLGPRRGLEDLCAALPLLRGAWEVEIRARASADAEAWFRGMLPRELWPRVRLTPVVPPDQVSAAVAAHDVGMALETRAWRSRDVTVTNKMFEYLQNGLRVAASRTLGQEEALMQVANAGALYEPGDPRASRQSSISGLAAGMRFAPIAPDCIVKRTRSSHSSIRLIDS